MAEQMPTRDELYARIRAGSKQEVILAEMRRLGFWPEDSEQPSPASSLLEREAQLASMLQRLGQERRLLEDPQAALKAMRQQRMQAARERRESSKRKRAEQRYQRALDWQQRRQNQLLYLGAQVSAGLNHERSDESRLARLGLPVAHDSAGLAMLMGLPLAELRFLCFDRSVSRISHYQHFEIAKKTGGTRRISAPMPRLKRAQYWVLDQILDKLPVHDSAHGFVRGRSILSNAIGHVGQAVLVNLDLKDFFPSVDWRRIKGVFASLGYSEQVATVLALLCSAAPCDPVEVDGSRFFVNRGPRALPQGAPTSPALSNRICSSLDRRLQALAQKLGFHYTRYADDLSFSAPESARPAVGKLLWRVKQVLAAEGFVPHPDKQRVMRDSARQEVTGIVVNSRPNLQRSTLRRFRAILMQIERNGPQGKHWNGNADVLPALLGYARFVQMVDPRRGNDWVKRVQALTASDSHRAGQGGSFRSLSARGLQPLPRWWTPASQPPPVLELTDQQRAEARRLAKPAAPLAPSSAPLPLPGPTPARMPAPPSTPPPSESETGPQPLQPADLLPLLWVLAFFVIIGIVLFSMVK